jgi:hypothetical protein
VVGSGRSLFGVIFPANNSAHIYLLKIGCSHKGNNLFRYISNDLTKFYLTCGSQIKTTGRLYVMQVFGDREGIRCGVVGWINVAKFRARWPAVV